MVPFCQVPSLLPTASRWSIASAARSNEASRFTFTFEREGGAAVDALVAVFSHAEKGLVFLDDIRLERLLHTGLSTSAERDLESELNAWLDEHDDAVLDAALGAV